MTLTGTYGYLSELGVIGNLTVSNGTWNQTNGYALFYLDRAGAKITLNNLTTTAWSSVVMIPGYTDDKHMTVINCTANLIVQDPTQYETNDAWYRFWNDGVKLIFNKDAASKENISTSID